MGIIYEIAEIMASFVELLILYRIYNLFFHRRRQGNEKEEVLVVALGTVLVQVCNHISIFSYFTMLLGVVYVSITGHYIYREKYMVLFAISSFYILCVGCMDSLLLSFVVDFGGRDDLLKELIVKQGKYRIPFLVLEKTIALCCYAILKKIKKTIAWKLSYSRTVLVVSCMGFLGFVFLTEVTFQGFGKTITGIWFVFVVLLAFFLFVFYFVTENKEQKMNLKITQTRNQLLEENYQALNDIYTSNAKLYHDLNNHLNVLYQFLEEGEMDEAKKYIREISQPIQKLTKTVWTGVDVADVIINSKVEKMRNKGISWDIDAEFPKNTNIQPYDLCTILSNLLDNAVEAVERTGKPGNISLTIRKINYFLMIRITNSCIGKNNCFATLPKTTKEDKTMHGWGLQNVQETVQKYGGTLKFRQEENQFSVDVMMFFEGETEEEKE